MADYDVVVLGGGPGGYAAAFRASLLGLKVAMVERDKVGGTCLHRGCIPTKGLLHAAEVLDSIRDASTFGINAGEPEVDWAGIQKFKGEPVKRLYAGLQSVVKHRKVDLVEGNGRLGERPGTIVVDGKDVSGSAVVLAPGSYARTLPGLDPDGRLIMTSDDALVSDRLPRSIVVIGGGAVGVEFASIYRSFGSEVTVVEMLPRLLPFEDADVSKELQTAFQRRGITVHVGATLEDVDKGDDTVRVTVSGRKTQTFEAESLLVAVGRGAATDGLGLERWGISTDRGFITVDEKLRCAEDVYAIGDCVAGVPQFAHVAFGQGFAAAERVAGGAPADVDLALGVPRAVYCHPEVAAVGMTEERAKEAGADVQVSRYPFGGNAKAQILGYARGFAKIVAERGGRILGVHMIGPRVTENIAEALLAVGWEGTNSDVASFVHPHPTLSEAIGEAALAAIGRPLHG